MLEPMLQAVEVWVVAADRHPNGVPRGWLLNDPYGREEVVYADTGVHGTAQLMLDALGFGDLGLERSGDRVLYTHSTSWREDDQAHRTILTYIAFIDAGPEVLARHPEAMPFSASALLEAMGPPAAHGPTERPEPRDLDVLLHAVGHVADRFQRDTTCNDALTGTIWEELLQLVQPELAGMFLRGTAAA